MKRLILFFTLMVGLLSLTPATMQTQDLGVITIRLSYKVVLNPSGGTRPPGVTDADINFAVNQMNEAMKPYYRGYRFQVIEIADIGGNGQTTGPSQWYSTNFFDPMNGGIWKDQMEAAAQANAAYLWRNNAINLYITNGICGGICSFPGQNDEIVIVGGCSDADGVTIQLHEIGHYFNLCHTQGCPCGGCSTCAAPQGDDVNDTLPDRECWTQNDIAQNAFGQNYAQLTGAQQKQVDDVFFNVMSYHNVFTNRLTEQQLDRWSQSANIDRVGVRTGRMIFAQADAPAGGNGSPASPFNTMLGVWNDILFDPNPNIVILRPGSFGGAANQSVLFNTPVTLRATREGAAIIGTSAPPIPAANVGQDAPPTAATPISQTENEEEKRTKEKPQSVRPRLGFAGSGVKKP